jgi:hypothetical protein
MKLLFLPHCLVKEQKEKIAKEAKILKFEVFTVPGSSLVKRLLQEHQPEKVVGVACKAELELSEKYIDPKIKKRTIQLLIDGCKETKVNVEQVIRVLKELA